MCEKKPGKIRAQLIFDAVRQVQELLGESRICLSCRINELRASHDWKECFDGVPGWETVHRNHSRSGRIPRNNTIQKKKLQISLLFFAFNAKHGILIAIPHKLRDT